GEPKRIGTVLEKDPITSKTVHEIFTRYEAGESRIQIAKDLNARGIPSPGSSWKRKTRRKSGWQSSAIRAMLFNPLYTGLQRWNVSRFVRDPDSGQYLRRRRKQTEWVQHRLEHLRIVSDELFERVGKLRR